MNGKRGFSLIELLIVVLIIAILTILSSIIYSNYVRSGRRADGMDATSSIALAEERYRSNNSTYGTLTQAWSGGTSSPAGYYTMAVSSNTATGYTITATATGDQANDIENTTSCATLTYTVSNGSVSRTPVVCWPQ